MDKDSSFLASCRGTSTFYLIFSFYSSGIFRKTNKFKIIKHFSISFIKH